MVSMQELAGYFGIVGVIVVCVYAVLDSPRVRYWSTYLTNKQQFKMWKRDTIALIEQNADKDIALYCAYDNENKWFSRSPDPSSQYNKIPIEDMKFGWAPDNDPEFIKSWRWRTPNTGVVCPHCKRVLEFHHDMIWPNDNFLTHLLLSENDLINLKLGIPPDEL